MIKSFFHAGVVAAIFLGLNGCNDPTPQLSEPPPPEVTVAHPIQREIVEWDYYTGRTEAAKTVEIRARVSGYLDEIAFEPGKIVEKGDLLFVIDQRPYQAVLAQARAGLKRARAQLTLAITELERAEQLVGRKLIAREEYDQRLAERQVAQAEVMEMQAAVESARLDLNFTEIRAPIGGRISRQLVDGGNLIIGGGEGNATLLAILVSIDPIYVYIDADERAVLKYRRLHQEGSRVSARYARILAQVGLATDKDFPFQGIIDYVAPRANPSTGTVRARIVIPNPDDQLSGGFFARVRIPGSGRYRATLITDRAISQDQGQKFVYVVNDENKVAYRRVELGPIVDGLRIVRAGLEPEERIIIKGVQRAREGIEVSPQLAPMTAPEASTQTSAKPLILEAGKEFSPGQG
ncbi:efflux RND transporter periplasmic adaptor subunit [Nitrosococcus oceani]|uniref:Secretion protein HlyD n=2 Tax=Nitrosococcus oceani TaxID=1229 RepID=Q3JA50_NITOC|nr:efflux RND transporter periplasmic adaptor subunit [Nitrosococcus oceani]KFI19226.1 secretion protein HlyD [Nitrosococcus oceani C-27]ABA58296.1 Secretion protein HlyD [Nitrosococcus oceani ATCC 19707]EDZ68580.1 auxiliary transport protein, MFP family, putative [Nitrosococcus oceani AFC27]KFI22463.1 secretion protein HlyD [Nitrosococcus oceani]GEM18680.1 MexE family multidrug efflux RND transporter periplasmic adaptor subunit [Nitrosococcus oceani]